METMAMERNMTSSYEYSSAFPFERDFDQWHYKRWTEDNWVGSNSKQDSDILLTARLEIDISLIVIRLTHSVKLEQWNLSAMR